MDDEEARHLWQVHRQRARPFGEYGLDPRQLGKAIERRRFDLVVGPELAGGPGNADLLILDRGVFDDGQHLRAFARPRRSQSSSNVICTIQ